MVNRNTLIIAVLLSTFGFSFTSAAKRPEQAPVADESLEFPVCYGHLPPRSINPRGWLNHLSRALFEPLIWPRLHDLCVQNINWEFLDNANGGAASLKCRCKGSKNDKLVCMNGRGLANPQNRRQFQDIELWCQAFCICPGDEENFAIMQTWMEMDAANAKERAKENRRRRPKKHTRPQQDFSSPYDLNDVFRKFRDGHGDGNGVGSSSVGSSFDASSLSG
jgi:hypothetical protein